MHDYPRQRLAAIIAQYGTQTAETPARLRGLLNDYLKGKYKLETSVLVAAAEERIPEALTSTRLPKAILFSQLANRLQQDRAFTSEAANWAVESWALALGVINAPYQLPPETAPLPAAAPGRFTHPPRWWAIPGYVVLLAAAALYLTDYPWCRQYAWLCPVFGGLGAAGVLVALYDTVWPALTFLALAVAGYFLGSPHPDWLLVAVAGLGASLSLILLVAVRARREPVPVANARLRPETARQLQSYLRYYVRGQLLYAPFTPLVEQYRRIKRTISRYDDWQQSLLLADDILAVDPMEYTELENRFHKVLHDYRAFHDRLISRIVIGTPLMNPQTLKQAGLDPTFEATYAQRLEAAATGLQPLLQEVETQRRTLMSQMPQLRKILSRGGLSEIIKIILELLPITNVSVRLIREGEQRLLIQLARSLEQYLQRWDNLIRWIDTTVIPVHQQIYEDITQQSLQKSLALFDQFDTAQIPLRPLLKELEKSNRQAAKVLKQGMV